METNKDLFVSPTKGELTAEEMIGEISDFIDEEPASFYRVVIGTDSQTRKINGKTKVDFVTAVIIHRKGRGGKYFLKKEKKEKAPVLRDKIYTETQMSLEIAQSVVPEIRRVITAAKYDLEIHIDVGALGPTRDMIKEVVGMVNGNGFTAKTKPDSWGASSVADKHA